MKSLEIAKALERSFADRGSRRLNQPRGVSIYPHGSHRAFVVLDLSVSRRVLMSKSFAAYNYFHDGTEWLEQSGKLSGHLKEFFEQGLLFREWTYHHALKHEIKALLNDQSFELERFMPRIEAAIRKRSNIDNALDFSRLFTRLCVGFVVSGLTGCSLAAAIRALRRRENIFYYYFHPTRHQRLDATLAALFEDGSDNARSDAERILAQSLVVMGFDPLIGGLCAALLDDECDEFVRAPARYTPTSFVSRRCVEEADIDGYRFEAGDICYVSLVPAGDDEAGQGTFPFGLGVHACVGKQFSLALLELGQAAARRCFPSGFTDEPVTRPDGGFLAFEHDK